jgi:hypothetical protein
MMCLGVGRCGQLGCITFWVEEVTGMLALGPGLATDAGPSLEASS